MATVHKWGDTLAVRIPADVAATLGVKAGSHVELTTGGGVLVVTPVRRRYRLKALLKGCKPSTLHGETHFGADVGREVLD